jgi:hypothetical protein
MKPSTLQKTILNTYQNFFSNKNIIRRLLSGNWYSLYYLIFYKLTMKPVLTQMENYLKYLEKIEQGFYDKNENLIEEKLPLFNIDSESIAKLLH